ncbi:hypothetical protein GT347_26950 [Xylophilus rhododendri]|uniref:Uncharacterized protein n=1 Tax=Xylophilus rhododendri TaxID=2697032 RepID=A0A857JF45_9BURK|nr:hypothetical protein [Xylophilus rhododendri]QHJ01306.1 hypothetical protein GT347_26950 [Xylophilus rhododendri]
MSTTPLLDDDADSALTRDALRTYARNAGQRAHDQGLAVRGFVLRARGDELVRESRDGSVAVLRPMAPAQQVRAGLTLHKRR